MEPTTKQTIPARKSTTLWQQYYGLKSAADKPSITPERKAEADAVAVKVKHAAKAAELTERQQEAVARIDTLRAHTLATGYRTTLSQNEILNKFSGAELADILRAVNRG
jgi:uncharacterized protein YoaH (UPF0181 family)